MCARASTRSRRCPRSPLIASSRSVTPLVVTSPSGRQRRTEPSLTPSRLPASPTSRTRGLAGESDGLACVTDLTREGAEKLDAADLLAPFRDRFVIDDPSVIYMDGNSLGRLPIATERRLAEFIRQEWGGELIRGWDHWLTLPGQVGDRLGAALLGAAPG